MAKKGRFWFGWLAVGLLSIVFAEALVLVMDSMSAGNFLAPLWSATVAFGIWMYGYVGPVLVPLSLLTILYLYVAFRLARIYLGTRLTTSPAGLYRALRVVETVAPALGFLGTTLAILEVMANIDPGLGQSGMIKTLFNNSASAFGSTIFGLVLSIAAYLMREAFENFLLEVKKKSESFTSNITEVKKTGKKRFAYEK